MPKCDHFIYTAAKIGNNEGYQIIAKSPGITDEIISKLTKYLYPLGVKVSTFQESRSLLILPNEKIAYSIVKNIGIGYDGRRGTLYNHTFVIDKNEFEKLEFDSRFLDKYFIQDDKKRGELKLLKIESTSIPINFKILNSLGDVVLTKLLQNLFKGSKIALVKTDELYIIQNLLAVLPSFLRLIPFSTLVIEPDRQYKFNFIQIPENIENKLPKTFVTVDPMTTSKIPQRNDEFDESIDMLVDVIQNKDEQKLKEINRDFRKISSVMYTTKRIKINDIFNELELEKLVKSYKFSTIKQNVKKLYSSRKFNQASPKVIVSITRKIRKILKNSLKNQKFDKKSKSKYKQIVEIIEILLDCMNYMEMYSKKQISLSVKNQISSEIRKLDELLQKYSTPETAETPYVFNYYDYVRWQCDQLVKYGAALTLWFFGKR